MTEKTKHTPGPWRLNNNIGRKGELGIVADDAPCIIAIMGNAKEWPVEAQANARLIAAAPALLEACKIALQAINECDMEVGLFNATEQEITDKLYAATKQAEKEG